MSITRKTMRPISLRRPAMAMAATTAAALLASAPAHAQSADKDEAEDLGTLEYKESTADSNPYSQEGAPYKAKTSGDPRRTVPLVEIPATIQVLTQTQIQESGETDLRDILDGTPGVTVGTGENGNAFGDRYIIRGQEARSDVFVDGLRDPGMTTRESFAVEQIEITKGPSASFGGRGTTGGAVNSITKMASTDYNFNRIDAGIGTDNYYRVTLDSNLPINDSIAVRANLLYANEDVPNRQPSDRERWGGALSASIGVSDNVRVVLDYYHLTANDLPDLGSYVAAPTGTSPSDVKFYKPWDEIPAYAQKQDFLESEVDTFTARVFIEPSDNFKIINSTRYGTTDNGYVVTGLRGGAVNATTGIIEPLTLSTHNGWQEVEYFVNQFNVFANINTAGIEHKFIVGAEYSNLNVVNGVYGITNTGAFNCRTGTATVNNAYCLTGNDLAPVTGDINTLMGRQIVKGNWDSDWRVETMSLSLMDTVDVSPWLTLHGGLRMDSFQFSNTLQNTNTLVQTPYRYKDSLWAGHAGVVVKPTEEGIVYFSYGTSKEINGGESDLGGSCGYGGICTGLGTNVGDGKPETATNLEFGTKWDLFDDRFMVQAAVFQLTKDDVFESAGTGYESGGSLNTGKHRIKGFEIGLVGNITPKLSGQVSFSMMDSKILRTSAAVPTSAPAGSTYVGKRLSNFANTHFNAQLRYQATDAFAFGGTATFKGKQFTGQPDTAAGYNFTLGTYSYEVPAYWTFDAFASYQFNETFGARVNVNNVTDEDYYVAGYRSGHFLYKGDERRATLTLTAKF